MSLLGCELAMLMFDNRAPLADRQVWILLMLLAFQSAQNWDRRRWAQRAEPVPDRYAYTPSRQDLRLSWLALALPGLGLLAVAVVLVAHSFTAHS